MTIYIKPFPSGARLVAQHSAFPGKVGTPCDCHFKPQLSHLPRSSLLKHLGKQWPMTPRVWGPAPMEETAMDQTARGRGHPATALTVPKEAASKAAPPASNSSPVWPQTQTSPRPARSSQGIYCPSRSLWISAALAPGSSLCSHCGCPRLLGQDLALPQWMLCPHRQSQFRPGAVPVGRL